MLGFVLLAGILFWVLYKYWVSAYKFWEHRGMPYLPGMFPFGTDIGLSTLTKFQGHSIAKMYQKTSPRPYFGIYTYRTPVLVIRDPEIIRLVLDKEFSHFKDRQAFSLSKNDLLAHHLFNLEGEQWRALRKKITPAFSSGRLKAMYPLFTSCAEELSSQLFNNLDSTVDIKYTMERFTTDVICSCAFGSEVNLIKDSDISLRKLAPTIFGWRWNAALRVNFIRAFPFLCNYMPFRLVPKNFEDYLIELIRNTVEHRKKNDIKRQDFLDLLIEMKDKGKLDDEENDGQDNSVEMTIELMAAQCVAFFAEGFETSSSVQSYSLYELALNPDIQERLRKEIDTTIAKHGELTYQAVQDMEYLDMVVHETMRKYPALPIITRRCTKKFSMPAGNSILEGERLVIPIWALHHDPDFFPNPEKFDPERFSPENKDSIKPFSYLPFGEGPRICIGMRFGLLQTKVGLITILRRYKVSPSEKTSIPLELRGSLISTMTKGPILLKISKR